MLKDQDIIICTVKKVEGTTVFVDIMGGGTGSIFFSEIAAGRIRNVRDYVHPNKLIVCKVLKVHPDNIELSFRRVTAKERETTIEKYEKENTLTKILKINTKNPEKIIEDIKKEMPLNEFYDKAREDSKIISEFLPKNEIDNISKILAEKREKEKIVRKKFSLKTSSESGLSDIKHILKEPMEIRYLGSGNFSISSKAKDFKEAEQSLQKSISNIEKKAKKKRAFFELKEK